MFFKKRPSVTAQVNEATAKLNAAYDQLADGNRVRTVAEFHAYGSRWGVDTHTLVGAANAKLDQVRADAIARRARRAA